MTKISIDLDGVICEFTPTGIRPIVNQLWPDRMPVNYQPSDWNHTDIFKGDDVKTVMKEVGKVRCFWETLKPYKENAEALSFPTGKEVYFVTSRVEAPGGSIVEQTSTWLAAQDISDYEAIVPVVKADYKIDVMRAIGIKFSLDDYGPTVEQCNTLEGHKAFVMDRPWNRDREYGPRVHSVAEFLEKAN